MHGEESELRKTIDFIRMGSIVILLLHFYGYCYYALEQWGLTLPLIKRILTNLYGTGLFRAMYISKIIALGLLALTLVGARGKKMKR